MNVILDNATQQIVYEVIRILTSLIGLVIAYYIKDWIATSAFSKKHDLEKYITQETIDEAVMYAEDKGNKAALKGIEKKQLATKYLSAVDPKLVNKLGSALSYNIDLAVAKKFNEK